MEVGTLLFGVNGFNFGDKISHDKRYSICYQHRIIGKHEVKCQFDPITNNSMRLKDKSNLFLIILPIIFFALHYFVYLGKYQSPFDGNEAFPDWLILVSYGAEPLSIEKIVLTKSIYPDYLHPFQNLEYHYAEKPGTETVILEQSSMFSSKMNVTLGDPSKYYDSNRDGIFYRGFGGGDYPNVLFFLTQYLIIVAFIFLVCRKVIQLKKSNWHTSYPK